MAFGAALQVNVVGVATVLPFAGDVSCGAVLVLQFDACGTVNVRVDDASGSHPSARRAMTNHVEVPLTAGFVSVVALVTPASVSLIHSSYDVAPLTEDQANVTGEVTGALFAGEVSDGAIVEHEGGAAMMLVDAEAKLLARLASSVSEVTSAVLTMVPLGCGAARVRVMVLLEFACDVPVQRMLALRRVQFHGPAFME